MPTPLFNPDHSTSILLENGQNPAIRESYTIAQILNFAASLGNDSVIIKPDFVNYDQTSCYYQIYSFNLGSLNEYYVASGDWYDTNPETQSDIFIQSITGSTGLYEQCKVIALTNNGLSHVNTVQYNVLSTLKTKDGVNYLDFNWNIYGRQTDPYIFATNADIGTLYINGSPLITNIWHSVAAIKGINGILQLTTLSDDIINNGNPVSNATADGINFSSDSALDVLCGDGGWWFPTKQIDTGYFPDPIDVDALSASYFEYSVTVGFDYALESSEYVTGSTGDSVSYSGIHAWLGILIDNDNEVAKFSIVYMDNNTANTFSYNQDNSFTDAQMHALWLLLHENVIDPEDDEDTNGNEDAGDEDTTKRTDRPAAEPDMPACDSIGTGFVSLWKVDKTNLQSLSDKLWSDDFWDVINKFFADPREVIIGCQIMPVTPTSGTEVEASATEIISGRIHTSVYGFKFLKQFKKVDCGTIKLTGTGNNFFAYSPYTSIAIYLPFCGYHDLDVNDLMKTSGKTGSTLKLKYVFDFLSGTCVAMLAVNGSYKYFFSGNCAQQVPITSADYRDILKNSMSLGASIGAGMITQGSGGMTAPASTQAADMMNSAINAIDAQPHIAFSSGGGATAGYLQSRRPCLVISEPIPKKAVNQWHYTGKQALQTGKIDNVTGYTKILEAHFSDIPCTAEERDDIFKQFKAGVMINASASELPTVTPSTGEQAIVLIKNKSENRVMRKKWTKSQCSVQYGKLFFEKGVTKPTFVLSGDFSAFNYAYVPALDRFYYITNQTINTGSIRTLELDVDALESWKNDIKDCSAVFERQENMANWYMQDNMYFAEGRKNVTTIPFNTVAADNSTEFSFKNTGECYVLTVAGG